MHLNFSQLYFTIFVLVGVFMQSLAYRRNVDRIPKIAIIGAGIGGTSTAYFLRQLFGEDGANIDIYEAGTIGGRLATTEINNKQFEVGGCVIHPRNKYMQHFMKVLGLEKNSGRTSQVALYDGDEFIFQSSEYYFVTVLKMLWRYGLGPYKLETFINKILDKFDSIYKLQAKGESYETVQDLLKAMSPSFVDALTNSTYNVLKSDHFSEEMIREIVEAALRVNYGQDTNVQSFVGSVSIAGTADELFSIKGGNKQVPERLLNISKVILIPGEIRSITLNREFETGYYLLNYTLNHPEIPVNIEKAEFYDIVILATPLTFDMKHHIEFKNFEHNYHFTGKYHRTVCTIIQGDLNRTFFGIDENSIIPDIISINNRTFFNSISKIENVERIKSDVDDKVWKIFSQNILTTNQINLLFSNVKYKKVIDWLAYPDYDTSQRSDKFVLHDYIFHVNAIEWAASAMEMSVIGAKNVALLTYKAWTGNKLPLVNEPPVKRQKTEL